MMTLLVDALSERIDFYKQYLLISIVMSISLGITMFVAYILNSPEGQISISALPIGLFV